MGLDTSHDCWHGPYSFFNDWRRRVAQAIGMDLDKHWEDMHKNDPVKSKVLAQGAVVPPEYVSRPLMRLLDHADCDGILKWEDCAAIADDLESIIDELSPRGASFSDREYAARWIRGLRKAAAAKEDVEFH